jgi:hypothetical protein
VIELAFVVGVALGTIVTGFCAIGSYDRGYDSVRRKAWSRELTARKQGSSRSGPAHRKGSLAKAG